MATKHPNDVIVCVGSEWWSGVRKIRCELEKKTEGISPPPCILG